MRMPSVAIDGGKTSDMQGLGERTGVAAPTTGRAAKTRPLAGARRERINRFVVGMGSLSLKNE